MTPALASHPQVATIKRCSANKRKFAAADSVDDTHVEEHICINGGGRLREWFELPVVIVDAEPFVRIWAK